jgi:hypothetical protein
MLRTKKTRPVLDRFQDSSKTSSGINFFPTFLAAFLLPFFATFFANFFLPTFFGRFFRKTNFECAVQTFAALWRKFCRLIA